MFRIFGAKCRAHPENEVGLMVMGGRGSVRPSSPLLSYLCTGQHTPVATISVLSIAATPSSKCWRKRTVQGGDDEARLCSPIRPQSCVREIARDGLRRLSRV